MRQCQMPSAVKIEEIINVLGYEIKVVKKGES